MSRSQVLTPCRAVRHGNEMTMAAHVVGISGSSPVAIDARNVFSTQFVSLDSHGNGYQAKYPWHWIPVALAPLAPALCTHGQPATYGIEYPSYKGRDKVDIHNIGILAPAP